MRKRLPGNEAVVAESIYRGARERDGVAGRRRTQSTADGGPTTETRGREHRNGPRRGRQGVVVAQFIAARRQLCCSPHPLRFVIRHPLRCHDHARTRAAVARCRRNAAITAQIHASQSRVRRLQKRKSFRMRCLRPRFKRSASLKSSENNSIASYHGPRAIIVFLRENHTGHGSTLMGFIARCPLSR